MNIIFLPIIGKAHVAYISNGDVIGLSKINRIVDYYRKTSASAGKINDAIVDALKEALGTKDVACIIDAKHLCVNCRGIKDTASSTITAELSGIFRTNPITRQNSYIMWKSCEIGLNFDFYLKISEYIIV